ncbi:unnamed protein product [Effrenium voratum]|nr:unnamed protein product [Effrenium voratum]
MREAEAKLEASEDVVEEVAAIATSLAFAQAIAAPKAVSRLCFSVEQTLAELQSRCQAKRQADQADGSLKASDFLQLSWEQKDAVEYPHSLFLQGRSGTGKTLVLVQRILLRREEKTPSQLFITKSHLLRDTVVQQLRAAGVPVIAGFGPWPPQTAVLCLSWNQLASHFGAAADCIRFQEFKNYIFPTLRRSCSGLSALSAKLVWTEFTCALRPFARWHWNGLDLEEYLKCDVSGQGVHLTPSDRRAVHRAFSVYTIMKEQASRKDEVDVAMNLQARLAQMAKVDEVFVDEVQDFAPAQLSVLLQMCSDPHGFTVAGDTCQTINPGSAFCFADIMNAHVKILEHQRREKNDAQLDCISGFQVLRYNYRCAPGIRGLANTVTGLLFTRFPRSCDHIEEIGETRTQVRPLLIQTGDACTASVIAGTGLLQFDAAIDASSAAILVPDDAVRDRLRARGCQVTTLTVSEAKGLEFDLVILVDLLGKSNYQQAIGELADENSEGSHLAMFAATADPGDVVLQHSDTFYKMVPAIHELKILYTAITRSRFGCAILEADAATAPWGRLLCHWIQQGAVEYLSDVSGYADRAEKGPQNPTSEDLPIDTGAVEETSESESETGVALPAMVAWLEAELEQRSGRLHRQARRSLREELDRLESSEERVDPSFCQDFFALHGMLIEPDFEWQTHRKLPQATTASLLARSQAAAAPGTEKALPSSTRDLADVPSLVVFMRQHFQEKPVEDLRIPLRELQGHAKQLLMHALDSPRERQQIFTQALDAARRSLSLAEMVLQVQLLNEGREQAPRQLWCPIKAAPSTAWRHQLAVLLQGASSRRCHLRRLRKVALWEQIFSFVDGGIALYDQVFLVAERVAEHDTTRHALLQVLVQCKAGLKWMTATQRIDLSRVKESLDERERLLSLHDLHSPWTIWFDAWQEAWQQRAGLVTYCAWTARAMYGACTCNRGEEQFKCCTCMQQEPISRKWARLVLRCFTRDALQRFQSFKMPGLQGKLQPLRTELGKKLCQVRKADFKCLLTKADQALGSAEEALQHQLAKIQSHHAQCAEAGRMFLFAGDVEHAAEATTEATTFVKDLLDLSKCYPILHRGPLRKVLASVASDFRLGSLRFPCGSGVQAALCWTFLSSGGDKHVSAWDAWRRAEEAFASLPDMYRAAVCAMQCQKWRQALTYVSASDDMQGVKRQLICLCASGIALQCQADMM